MADFPLPGTDLSHGSSDGDAEGSEAVQHGHANLKLGNLKVEGPHLDAFPQQVYPAHFGFDLASAGKAVPSSASGWNKPPRGARAGARAIAAVVSGFQGLAILRGGMIVAATHFRLGCNRAPVSFGKAVNRCGLVNVLTGLYFRSSASDKRCGPRSLGGHLIRLGGRNLPSSGGLCCSHCSRSSPFVGD